MVRLELTREAKRPRGLGETLRHRWRSARHGHVDDFVARRFDVHPTLRGFSQLRLACCHAGLEQLPKRRGQVWRHAPDAKTAKPDDEGKLTWNLDLKPGEKRELTVKFTVEHPKDIVVDGLD